MKEDAAAADQLPADRPGIVAQARRHSAIVLVSTVLDRYCHLAQVAAARDPETGLTHLLDSGEQQADQDGDDGNHDQQLDQREATPPSKDAEDWHEDTSWKKQRRRENGERSRKRERG